MQYFMYVRTITFFISDELDQELGRWSFAAHTSKNDFAREAMQRYLQVCRFRELRSQLVSQAQTNGVHTDTDVFRVLDSGC